MRKLYILFFLIVSIYSYANVYPINPRPLRKLVIESQNIIIGHVDKVEKIKIKKGKWNESFSTATIVIKQRIKGNIKKDTIRINFDPNMSCPQSDMYYENTDVLAFVDFKDKKYYTHALSYGSKTLDKEGLDIYLSRIKEIQEILSLDEDEEFEKTVEWLVKCAENEYTQWEGTFELSPESDFMSSYSHGRNKGFKAFLSIEQKNRLKIALLKGKNLSYPDFGLIDLVYEGNENEIDEFMLRGLQSVVDEEYNWTALDFMNRLIHLNECKETIDLIKELDSALMDYDKDKKAKNIILNFMKLIDKKTKKQLPNYDPFSRQ